MYQGNAEGYLYGWQANKRRGNRPQPDWTFRAGGAINDQVVVYEDRVLFGANDGRFYCLDKRSGEVLWQYAVDQPESRAFRHFSAPYAADGKVAVGGADRHGYVFDIASGELLLKQAVDDWVRAAPVFRGNTYFFATVSGRLYGVNTHGEVFFEEKISTHPILADLALGGDKIVINDSDLYAHCRTLAGEKVWTKSLIESFEKDGERILSDQIAGGAYYQSKPTAADGTVFFGTPARFVYAIDAQTGREKWKFEVGASISGAPTYYDGNIYFGQQGAEDDFYCLDATTGELVWKQSVDWVWGSATASDGMVYVPGIDGYAWALDAQNGHVVWKKPFSPLGVQRTRRRGQHRSVRLVGQLPAGLRQKNGRTALAVQRSRYRLRSGHD